MTRKEAIQESIHHHIQFQLGNPDHQIIGRNCPLCRKYYKKGKDVKEDERCVDCPLYQIGQWCESDDSVWHDLFRANYYSTVNKGEPLKGLALLASNRMIKVLLSLIKLEKK